ncbi:hypothetical protein EJ04DRAFT_569167 [Polyplosphaeria fusca]|uniref:Uncharacterized protein n=1 Tax=Polyplosphaeria fusca TaxID=682080 RepID=A0A9P4QNV8_9PLEO|nr:hypothetical protein EJ04DRAFT_569167 [Polyplosphaeria fusca]
MLGRLLILGFVALSSVVHSAPTYIRHEDDTVALVENRDLEGGIPFPSNSSSTPISTNDDESPDPSSTPEDPTAPSSTPEDSTAPTQGPGDPTTPTGAPENSNSPIETSTPPGPEREDLACTDVSQHAGAYVSAQAMQDSVNDFCDKEINGGAPGDYSKEYLADTYDSVRVSLKNSAQISSDACKQRMTRIVNDCVPASNNPLNWKYGGDLNRDDSHYTVFVRDEFWIYGAGFLGSSEGVELRDQMRNCAGPGLSDWSFEYYDKPDADGMEWKAFGHTTVFQKNCFSPVIKGSGGPDILAMGVAKLRLCL